MKNRVDFLARLRELSVERCEQYFFPLNRWSVLEWAGAMCGEAGETANVAKKLHRIATKHTDKQFLLDEDELQKIEKLQAQLADEIADTIIYLDLLAASQGIDLETAVTNKFNELSKKHGYKRSL